MEENIEVKNYKVDRKGKRNEGKNDKKIEESTQIWVLNLHF